MAAGAAEVAAVEPAVHRPPGWRSPMISNRAQDHCRLLAREGYQVLIAKDGVEALEQLIDIISM